MRKAARVGKLLLSELVKAARVHRRKQICGGVMSIHKIPRKSGIRYQVKYLQSDGRQKAKNFRTKREAQDFEASIRSAKARGAHIDSNAAKIRFAEYVEIWRATKSNQRPRTAYRRDGILRRHLLPALGSKTLREIHRSDVQKLVSKWEIDGLAPRTIKQHIRILHPIFEMAVLDDIIPKNPIKGVSTPKPGKVERHVLTPLECRDLIDATPFEYQTFIRIALGTGLRFQELANLTVIDFDPQNKTLNVRSSKTTAGLRSVRLSDEETEMLKVHLLLKAQLTDDYKTPLFTSPNGLPIHYRNFIQRVFKKATTAADLPHIKFHDLRRTHATILINSGVNQKVVQERLGHQNITTTLALYAQGTLQNHLEAANATRAYLNC